jgi:hypothetical protein
MKILKGIYDFFVAWAEAIHEYRNSTASKHYY